MSNPEHAACLPLTQENEELKEALKRLHTATVALYLDAEDRGEVRDEDTGELYDDWAEIVAATREAEKLLGEEQ